MIAFSKIKPGMILYDVRKERRLKKALKHLRKSREQSRLLLREAKAVKAILSELKPKLNP